jgi:hypothetical protein
VLLACDRLRIVQLACTNGTSYQALVLAVVTSRAMLPGTALECLPIRDMRARLGVLAWLWLGSN